MANRYWVSGGTGNWNSTTNWSAASGGARNATVPSTNDVAIFDGSSGSGTCTINISPTIQSLNATGFSGSITCNNTLTITTNGGFTVNTGGGFGGSGTVNLTYTGSAATVAINDINTSSYVNFNFTGGTYALRISGYFNNVNFTGFSGSISSSSAFSAMTIFGNLTFSTGMTTPIVLPSSGPITFSGSATKLFTSNGKTVSGAASAISAIIIDQASGTVQLQDAASATTFYLQAGTLDLNGKTLTASTTFFGGGGVANLTFNGGTIVCSGSGNAWIGPNANSNWTTTAGTGTGKISLTSASTKNFTGGSSIGGGSKVYNCTLSNDGAGAVSILDTNTFTTLANGVQPTSFLFTAAATTTVTNWNINGTAGNLVTIGSRTSASHTLSKASGIVNADYLSISYSTATGGAVWNPGLNSVNGGNNSGWLFPSAAATGNFFFMF